MLLRTENNLFIGERLIKSSVNPSTKKVKPQLSLLAFCYLQVIRDNHYLIQLKLNMMQSL